MDRLVDHRGLSLLVGAVAALVASLMGLLLVNPWRGEPHVAGYVVAVDARDGKKIWERFVPGMGWFLGDVRVQDKTLLVTNQVYYQGCRGDLQTMRIDPVNGRVLHPDVQLAEGGVVSEDLTSYTFGDGSRSFTASRGSGSAVLKARDRASGRALWTVRLPGERDGPFRGDLPRRPSRTYAIGTVSHGVVYLAYSVDNSDCRID